MTSGSSFVHDNFHSGGFWPRSPSMTADGDIEVDWHIVSNEPVDDAPEPAPLLLAAPKSEHCPVCGAKKELRHRDLCSACEELSALANANPVRTLKLLDGTLAVGQYVDSVGLTKPFHRGRVWLKKHNYDQHTFAATVFSLLAMVPELVATGVYREFVEVTGFSPMFSAPGRTACPLYDVDVELGKHGEIRLKSVRRLTEEEAFEREDSAHPHPVDRTETETLRVGEPRPQSIQELLASMDKTMSRAKELLAGADDTPLLTVIDGKVIAAFKEEISIDDLSTRRGLAQLVNDYAERKRGHTG